MATPGLLPRIAGRRAIGGLVAAAILAALGIVLGIALWPSERPAELSGQDVWLTAGDGAAIRGLQSVGADDWVIFLHGEGEELASWSPLWETLAADDYTLLALELTPRAGSVMNAASEIRLDAEAAFQRARAEGAATISVVAAGLGGIAALQARDEQTLSGLVLLSPGPVASRAAVSELRGAGEAKLFVAGSLDVDTLKTAKALRNASIGWAGSISVPTSDQGTRLLTGEFASNVRFQVATFLSLVTGRPRARA